MIWVFRRVMLSRFLWLLVAAVLLGVIAERWVETEGGLIQLVERSGIWGPLIGWAAKTITSMTPIGAILLPVAFGAVFPFWMSVFLNVSSGVASGLVMYAIWRRGDHEFDLQSRIKQLPAWFRAHQGDNLFYLIALRQMPWAGGSLADLLAAAHRVPVRIQFLSLLIGNIPGAIFYTLVGKGLLRL